MASMDMQIINGVINLGLPFFDPLIQVLDREVMMNIDHDLQKIYAKWNEDNLTESGLIHEDLIFRNKTLLRHDRQLIPIQNCNLLGIDLPSWFGDYNSPNKIMIIGIDPMRNEKDFVRKKQRANIFEDVIIGTPYALHSKKVRKGKKNQNYTQFVSGFVQEGHFVYLTDVYKPFFYTSVNQRSYDYYEEMHKKGEKLGESSVRKNVLNCLMEEIQLMKPTAIITLGGISFGQLKGSDVESRATDLENPYYFKEDIFKEFKHIPIYPFMHLAARPANLQNFIRKHLKVETSTNYGTYFYEIARKYKVIS